MKKKNNPNQLSILDQITTQQESDMNAAMNTRNTLTNTVSSDPQKEALRQQILASRQIATFMKIAAVAILVRGADDTELSNLLCIKVPSAAAYRSNVKKLIEEGKIVLPSTKTETNNVADTTTRFESKTMTYDEKRNLAVSKRFNWIDIPVGVPSKEKTRQAIQEAPLQTYVKVAAGAMLVHGATDQDLSEMLCVTTATAKQYRSLVKGELRRHGMSELLR